MAFQAWLVDNTSALDQPNADITIYEGEYLTRPDEDPADAPFTMDGTVAFHAVTTIPAENCDTAAAQAAAIDLMAAAGWRARGDWTPVDLGHTITVERD